jgi:hypothetical protein
VIQSGVMMRGLGILVLVLGSALSVKAGCAVAIAVDSKGSVSTRSESSLTPKGGHNFISAEDAASVLLDDLKRHGVTNAQIVFKSDQTGYFSLAIGHDVNGTLLNNVACAANPRESDKEALAALKARGVSDGAVVNRFHSYGEPGNN